MRSKMSAIGTSDSAFHDGNPSTGELGTIVTADWLNAVQASTMDLQDELLNVLAAASIANDPTVKTQILAAINKLSKLNMQSGSATFATDTGAANAYVVSLTPALAAPRGEGMVIRFKVANTNTGACTVNDGVSTVPIVGLALSALQGGEMAAGGDAWIQWHPSVGTGSYVLLFCSGAAVQVADATKSKQAVALGQLATSIGTTQPQFDSSKKFATTEFVQGIGLKFAGDGSGLLVNTTLTAAQANNWFEFEAASLTATLPPLSSIPSGSTYSFRGYAFGGTIKCSGSELVAAGNIAGVNSITILPGETIIIAKNGNEWYQISGGFGGSLFASSFGSSGIQRLPGGYVRQWGKQNVDANTTSTFSFPIAFTTALCIVASLGVPASGSANGDIVSASQYKLQNTYSGAQSIYWEAIGYLGT